MTKPSRAAKTEIPIKSNSVARLVWGSGPSVCFSGGATSPGMLMRMLLFRGSAIRPSERHEPQPEHVKRSQKRGEKADQPIGPARLVCPPKNLVLAEEPGERRNSCNGHRPRGHGPERPRNFFF